MKRERERFPLFVPRRSWPFNVCMSVSDCCWPMLNIPWASSTVLWPEKLRNGHDTAKNVLVRWTVRNAGRSETFAKSRSCLTIKRYTVYIKRERTNFDFLNLKVMGAEIQPRGICVKFCSIWIDENKPSLIFTRFKV